MCACRHRCVCFCCPCDDHRPRLRPAPYRRYGEDEKHVAAIFRVARRLAPCVIFLDEIDSLLGRRGSAHEHEATRRLRNEFLAQWDGLLSASSAGQRVLVLGATNRPFDLDEAALRRLPRRLALALPDGPAREQILRVLLADELGSVRGRHLDLAHLAGCAPRLQPARVESPPRQRLRGSPPARLSPPPPSRVISTPRPCGPAPAAASPTGTAAPTSSTSAPPRRSRPSASS